MFKIISHPNPMFKNFLISSQFSSQFFLTLNTEKSSSSLSSFSFMSTRFLIFAPRTFGRDVYTFLCIYMVIAYNIYRMSFVAGFKKFSKMSVTMFLNVMSFTLHPLRGFFS